MTTTGADVDTPPTTAGAWPAPPAAAPVARTATATDRGERGHSVGQRGIGPSGAGRPGVAWTRAGRRWISPVVLLAVWQLASSTGTLSPQELASPTDIVSEGWDLLADGRLETALAASLQRVVIGFAVGAVAGLVFGAVSGLSRWGEALLDPPLQMVRTLPFLGLIPLFILWFGIGELPKDLLIALGVAFPIYLNTFAGIRGVDDRLLEATAVLGFTRVERLRHVVLPAALPQVLVGLRQSLGIAWLSLVVAEQLAVNSGLGFLINNAREFLQTNVIVVCLLVYAILGLATDGLVRSLERRALAWRRPSRA